MPKPKKPNNNTQPMESLRLTAPVTLALPEASGGAEGAPAPARFSMLAHTGQIIDLGWYRFVVVLSGVTCKSKFPALREHRPDRICGTCTGWAITSAGLAIEGTMSQATDDAAEVLALAREGYPWQCSIGVRPIEVLELKGGQTRQVNGREVAGPLDIWMRSSVEEVSFVSLGADNETSATVLAKPQPKEDAMNAKLKALLVKLGLAATATDEDAQTFFDALDEAHRQQLSAEVATQTNAEIPPTVTLAGTGGAAGVPLQSVTAADLSRAIAEERQRSADIQQLCARHGLTDMAADLVARGVSLADARGQILDKLAERPGNAPVGRVDMGLAEGDKFRALAAEGIALANGWRTEKPQEGSREFRGLGLADMARLSLERAGINVFGKSRSDLATLMFSPQFRLSASISDFSAVYMDVANKILLQSYTEAGRTYDAWTSRVSARDFREMYGVSLSEAPNLQKVQENGEYPTVSLTDHKESYRIYKYGEIIGISYEMIVNDDLRAFTRIPSLLGAATSRTYSDIVYGLLLSNTVRMSDGKPLFDESHHNLAPASTIDNRGMDKTRRIMRAQRGMKGAVLNLTPSFLLVPPILENTAYVLLKSAALPQDGMSSAVYNPWTDSRITPIVEQRLEPLADSAPVPWYLVASPNQVGTIEVAYLDGQDAPTISQVEWFASDTFQYKARACMGAGIMDYRGLVKNPGVAA